LERWRASSALTVVLPARMAEAGLPDYQFNEWYGLVAPAGTPPDIVETLNREIAVALFRQPEDRRRQPVPRVPQTRNSIPHSVGRGTDPPIRIGYVSAFCRDIPYSPRHHPRLASRWQSWFINYVLRLSSV